MLRRLAFASSLLAVTAAAQNQGLSLQNGAVTYVDVPYSPTLAPTGGVTAEAWVTYDGSTLGSGWRFPTVLRMDPGPTTASYFLRVEAGQTRTNRLLWWVSTSNGNYSISYLFAASALLTWAHVAGTYDGTTLRLFVNGAQVAQGAGTGAMLDRNGVFRIGDGDLTVAGGETWNGEIDEVRVWPFARSAAAILSTMNLSLSAMPGELSTWNLDGTFVDSSGQNHGAGVGSPALIANSLVLQTVASPASSNYGSATGCRTTGLAAITAIANLGNSAFGFAGTRAPAGQGGFALLSLGGLSVPLPILGIDLLVDLNLGTSLFLQSSALGAAEVGFAIPNQSRYLGQVVFAQFAWLDPTCANGLSASNAVFATVLP